MMITCPGRMSGKCQFVRDYSGNSLCLSQKSIKNRKNILEKKKQNNNCRQQKRN